MAKPAGQDALRAKSQPALEPASGKLRNKNGPELNTYGQQQKMGKQEHEGLDRVSRDEASTSVKPASQPAPEEYLLPQSDVKGFVEENPSYPGQGFRRGRII